MSNKIKFKHFCGTLDRWNSKKSEWSDAIVFGNRYAVVSLFA